MRLELKRDALLIVPENDADRAYIEDTLKLRADTDSLVLSRVADVTLGYTKSESYVLKGAPKS